MPKLDDSVADMRRLYEVDGLTLQEIAQRFNVSKQAVHYRLKLLGVEFRNTGTIAQFFDRETLERLYIAERMGAQQLADNFHCSYGSVVKALKSYGVKRRGRGCARRKYPELRDLKVGESIDVEHPKTRGKFQSRFYPMGKSLGIRISVRTIDQETVRLTRVE